MSTLVTVKLHRIAHARAGDKGNRLNIGLFAYRPELWPLIAGQVTAARVAALFADRNPAWVKRYDLPLLHGCNFVIDNVLQGGVNGALNLDGHGKTLSFRLLGLDVSVPEALLDPLRG